MEWEKCKRCLAARRLPWPKHAEPKRELKMSNGMLRARRLRAAWLAGNWLQDFPMSETSRRFEICCFVNPR
jgi:hypothetical protein